MMHCASNPSRPSPSSAPGAVEFRGALEARLGVELPATLTFDYPTISAIAQRIASSLQPAAASPSPRSRAYYDAYDGFALDSPSHAHGSLRAAVPPQAATVSVAALTCRQPRRVLAAEASLAGVDAVACIPLDRWEVEAQAGRVGARPFGFASTLEVSWGVHEGEVCLRYSVQAYLGAFMSCICKEAQAHSLEMKPGTLH